MMTLIDGFIISSTYFVPLWSTRLVTLQDLRRHTGPFGQIT